MGKSGGVSVTLLDCTARVRQVVLGTLVTLKGLYVSQEPPPPQVSANPFGLEMNSHTNNRQQVDSNSFRG